MPKSLADIRAEKFTARPERPYRAVVGEGQKYVTEVQRLVERLDEVMAEAEAQSSTRKQGKSGTPAEATKINERLTEIRDLMGEYEGELTVRATRTDGEWAQWRIAHPARDEGQPGHRDDLMVTSGYCNGDDLIADLSRYVVAWEGERLDDGDFNALNLLPPDKKAIARLVVGLYETAGDLPKLRSGLSALLKNEPSSVSPEA